MRAKDFPIELKVCAFCPRLKKIIILIVLFLKPLKKFRCCESSPEKEKTLAIIKPDGLFGNFTEKIKNVILDSGFAICKEMTLRLDEDRVESFYAEHSSKGFFHSLVKYMTRYFFGKKWFFILFI